MEFPVVAFVSFVKVFEDIGSEGFVVACFCAGKTHCGVEFVVGG
jgi:hypothetical protein